MITPATRSWMATSTYLRSFSAFSSELHSTTEYPTVCATSSTPRAIAVKNGFSTSLMISASTAASCRRRFRAGPLGW